jgi:hypothetical protein
MAKKGHKIIGDPLKRFKEPSPSSSDPFQKNRRPAVSIIQEAPGKLREFFEGWMEVDARLGLPFMSAQVTSERTGLPDEWWFRKARALGRVFEDPEEFWKKERDECRRRVAEYEPTYLSDAAATEFFLRHEEEKKMDPLAGLNPAFFFDYTWEKCKAGLDGLPKHDEVPADHKGTFFAISTIARAPERVLGGYIKCGLPIVQDLVAEYIVYLTNKMSSSQKPKDWQEQLRILLKDVDWELVENVLKAGEKAYASKNMHNILKSYRNVKTPGDYYKRIMNP